MEDMYWASASRSVKWGTVLGLTLVYLLASYFLLTTTGQAILLLGLFPVIAAGWFFGLPGGIVSSVAVILLDFALMMAGKNFGLEQILDGDFIASAVFAVLFGMIAGRAKFEAEQHRNTVSRLRASERHVLSLNEITQKIMTSGDSESMYQILAKEATTLFDVDDCYIARWDAAQKLTIPLASSLEMDPPYSSIKYPPGEKTVTAAVMESGCALAVEDMRASPHFNPALLAVFPARSALGIPLQVGEYKFGAAVLTYREAHRFTADEINFAEQSGKHIALALWNKQQDFALQKRLQESGALSKISLALSESEHIGLSNVLQLIVDSAKNLIANTEQAVIHLLDADKNFLIPQALVGYANPEEGKRKMRLGEGVAGQVIASGEVAYIPDVTRDSRFIRLNPNSRIRSLIVAPVMSRGEKLGTISVQSGTPNAFNQDDNSLLVALGTQASIAIENARLLETTQQGLMEVNALYRINQGLVASVETDQLIKDTATLLQKNFGHDYVQVYIMDAQSGDLVLREATGEVGEKLKQQGHRLPIGMGIVGHVVETGEPFVTNNVHDVIFHKSNPFLPDTKSELAIPIKIKGQVAGALDIQDNSSTDLTQRHLQLIKAVADQLAVALQRASLYDELQNSLYQEKSTRAQLIHSERLAVVGRLLASVSHELNNPLQAIQNALFLLKEEKGISTQGKQDLQIVLSETERMAIMLERLRTAYRPTRTEDFQEVQVNDIIEDVYALVATHMRHKEITFEFLPDPTLPLICGISDQIRQITLNLFMNAAEAMQPGGQLTARTQWLPDEDMALFTVKDCGPGIDPALLPDIFEPFVTGKETGTGLGLTITHDIVEQHHGRIEAENDPTGGAIFKVWLPIAKDGRE